MQEETPQYTITNQRYPSKGTQVKADCSAMLFVNTGSQMAELNGMPIPPGSSFSTPDYRMDIDRSNYQLVFTGGGNPEVWVWRKTYLNVKY